MNVIKVTFYFLNNNNNNKFIELVIYYYMRVFYLNYSKVKLHNNIILSTLTTKDTLSCVLKKLFLIGTQFQITI